jgi:hypothetical protein
MRKKGVTVIRVRIEICFMIIVKTKEELTVEFVNCRLFFVIPNKKEPYRYEYQKYALVSHTSPVHWCKNAQDPDHDCVYAICYQCKMTYDDNNSNSDGKNKRSRKCAKRMLTETYENTEDKDEKDNETRCDHRMEYLQPTYDTLYFTSMYIRSVIEQEVTFPVKCSICHLAFSSEKINSRKK